MTIYYADLSIYKEYRAEYIFGHNAELIGIAKDIIYQNFWCDTVMYDFFRCNDDLETVIARTKIKSWDEYYDTGSLW
jgi:hypothetical protein